MHNFTIYHGNAIETAGLAGGSWDATLSLEKLRDPRPRLKATSTDAQLASTQFKASLIVPKSLIGIQLISTNLSQAASYKVSWYSDSSFTALIDTTGWVDVAESIDWTVTAEWPEWESEEFWLGAESFVDPNNLGRDIRVRLAVASTIQYLKVEVDDTGNADGCIKIGHGYIGEAFAPTLNFEPGSNRIGRVSHTSVRSTAGGARYYHRRAAGQSVTVAWPNLPMLEVLGEIDDIVHIHDVDKPVYFDLDPDNTGVVGQKTAFLATIAQLPEHSLNTVYFGEDISASVGFEFLRVL